MKRRLPLVAATLLAAATIVPLNPAPASAAVGLHISGTTIVEANGQTFVMRGVNHEHVWFTGQTQAFADIKSLGANTVRVVLGSGKRWGPSNDLPNVVSLCKQNKLICVLEVHDTTGYGEDGAAATLDEAVNYWISQKANLVGQEDYVVINIGNEPIGNNDPGQWTTATADAVAKMRANGFQHLLMVDAPNWGQDWQNVMRDTGQTVLDADTQHNTVLSIHMYGVYPTASSIINYLDAIAAKGWPLVIGEFGWQYDSSQVDDTTVMSEAVKRGLGYLGWSWSGNNDPILDMVPNSGTWGTDLTTWGQRLFNGPNGIKATSKEATIYGGTTTTTTRPTTTTTTRPTTTTTTTTRPTTTTTTRPTTTTTTTRPTTTTTTTTTTRPTTTTSGGGRTCAATYTVLGQWPGGFQADVRVTAGSSAISGWALTWTFADGQTITQAWGGRVAQSGAAVTVTNEAWNGSLGAGQQTSLGFLAGWNNSTNSVPTVSCAAS